MMVDLSAGGARILSQFPISVGDEIFMSIPLLEDIVEEIWSDVVWIREMELMKEFNFGVEYMAGVKFRQVNEKIRDFIKSFVGK